MTPLNRHLVVDTRSTVDARRVSGMFAEPVDLVPTGAAENFRLTVRHVGFAGIALSVVTTTGHRVRVHENGMTAVLMPWRGTIGTRQGRNELRASMGELIVPRAGHRETTVGPGYLGLVLQVPDRLLEAPVPDWAGADRQGQGLVSVRSGAGAAFARALRYVIEDCDSPASAVLTSERAATRVAALLADLVAACMSAPATSVAPASLRQVARAEAFARSNLDQPLRVADLAAAANVSPRALQAAFRAVRGCGPHSMLENARLEAARARLLAPRLGDTILSVGLDCGVTHLGRFARRYRARYGETPSATLMAARAAE